MIVGFTGTRKGMSEAQARQLEWLLRHLQAVDADGNVDIGVDEFHHGYGTDASGGSDSADRQAAAIARRLGYEVMPHPPKTLTPKELLARNRVVVGESQILIAAPMSYKEELRSGTWMTIRCAWQKGIPVVMLSRGRKE